MLLSFDSWSTGKTVSWTWTPRELTAMAFGRAAETERLHAAERYVAQMNCQCGLTKIRLLGRLITAADDVVSQPSQY